MTKAAPARADSPVVVFLGDATIVDPLVHALVDERMGGSSQSLDFETFRFGERPIGEIDAALRQVGMFATKRGVWLRGLVDAKRKTAVSAEDAGDRDEDTGEDDPASGAVEELLALLEKGLPDSSLLVISAAALDARSRLYKWIAKNADLRDRRVAAETGKRGGRTGEGGLKRAIEERLAELGVVRIEAGAVDEIVKRSGSVVGEALQEVDRVVLAQADPTKLAAAAVRATMRDLALGWVFDLTDALEARNLGAAEGLIAKLLADGEPPIRLAAVLASHVAKLVAARAMVDALPKGALRMRGDDFLKGPGSALPPAWQNWQSYFRLKAASNFRADELVRLHGEVRRLDLALKSSPSSPLLLFSRLLQSACIAAPAR
jgi:DNA polymerase III delta subunit